MMLEAVALDVASLPGLNVVTTLEAGLRKLPGIEVIPVESAADESIVFDRLSKQVDAVLVIAPETDGILEERCRRVRSFGTTSWNCTPDAIKLCSDKLVLARHLLQQGIPTIPTRLIDLSSLPDEASWPMVLKPRDGAGSWLTFLITNLDQFKSAADAYRREGAEGKCISQPFLAGKPLSVGVNLSFGQSRIERLPVAEQHLSDDGRFRYLGGTIPADISPRTCDRIDDLVKSVCRTIEGLAGYVGFDLLLLEDNTLLIVEVNPRLTTSYFGYRQLYHGKIPQSWISAAELNSENSDHCGVVEFRLPP